jgi:hypothetical protein
MIEAVKDFVEEDRRVSVKKILREFDIAEGTTKNLLHEDLGLVKRAARWMPRQLTEELKNGRVLCARAF